MEFSEKDRHGTASNRMDPVEDSQEDSEEEEASDTVRRVKEVVDGVSDEDIKSAMEMIKNKDLFPVILTLDLQIRRPFYPILVHQSL